MPIVLDGTTGITSPALDSDGSLTIGTAVMAVPSGDAPLFACRAWVNFDGTGTVAIRASGNVSSITDNGTGNYTVNFTTAMPDANYSFGGSVRRQTGVDPGGVVVVHKTVDPTTSALRIQSCNPAAAEDCSFVNVEIFR